MRPWKHRAKLKEAQTKSESKVMYQLCLFHQIIIYKKAPLLNMPKGKRFVGQVHSSHMPGGFAPENTKPVRTMSVKQANEEIEQMRADAIKYGSKGAFRIVTRSASGRIIDPATIKKAHWDALFRNHGKIAKKDQKRFPTRGFGAKGKS